CDDATPCASLHPRTLHDALPIWDQRGAARTLARNGPASADSLSLERMVQDGVELAEYLREHLDKDKLILVGHSFGSILGVKMARSEEHTSELQSRENLVCRLLLE